MIPGVVHHDLNRPSLQQGRQAPFRNIRIGNVKGNRLGAASLAVNGFAEPPRLCAVLVGVDNDVKAVPSQPGTNTRPYLTAAACNQCAFHLEIRPPLRCERSAPSNGLLLIENDTRDYLRKGRGRTSPLEP